MAHHIAQVTVSLPLEPLDSARLPDFVAALDPVNALADAAPGFVWRLPAGTTPTVAEARLRRLEADGPTGYAFTFRAPYPSADEWFCPA